MCRHVHGSIVVDETDLSRTDPPPQGSGEGV